MDINEALAKAAQEYDLKDYYIDIVRPLITLPREQWPLCCGGGCEPCMATVCSVADRALDLVKETPR